MNYVSKIQVSVKKQCCLRWTRNGISGAKNGDVVSPAQLGSEAVEYYQTAQDVVRHPGSSNIEVAMTSEDCSTKYDSEARAWCKRLFLSRRVVRSMMQVFRDSTTFPVPEMQPLQRAHYDAYCQVITDTPEGLLVIPEDKSPQESYIRSAEGHMYKFRRVLLDSGWVL